MPEKLRHVGSPTGLRRLLLRAPIHLYRWHLGWLLGGRFLHLTHIGRASGEARHVVLEVTAHDEAAGTYQVASGWGPRSQWYLNLRSHPDVTVQVGRRAYPATAQLLDADASGRAMVDYAHRHPRAARRLMTFCGYRVDGSDADYQAMGEHIPFVVFHLGTR